MGRTSGSRHRFVRHALLLSTLLACSPCVFALNPALDVSQYAHTSWKIRDGFSKGRITAIAQTPDGYLWLGTEFGLLRFDGVKAVPFESLHQPGITGSIFQLFVARDGTLWIGDDKGLKSWNGSQLTEYPQLAGQFVFSIIEDHAGTVWAGAVSVPTGKLCAISKAGVACFGEDGSLGRGIASLYEDSQRNLWAVAQDGLWRWRPDPPKFFSVAEVTHRTQNLIEDIDGTLLIGTSGGIKRFVSGKAEPYQPPGTSQQFRANSFLRDRDGGVWIATATNGLVHVHQGRTDVFSSSDGLSSDQVTTSFEDREGNIWIATLKGLDRFRDLGVSTFSEKQGLSSAFVYAVLATIDGSVLLVTTDGLNRLKDGNIRHYGETTGQIQDRADLPRSLFQDSRGRIWAVTEQKSGYLADTRFVSVSGVPGGVARSIAEDSEGSIWIANQNFGLFQLRDGQLVRNISWEKLGHKDFGAALAIDRMRGGLWVGFFGGGIAYFKDGEVRASYTATNGLGAGRVDDLRFDQDGALWVSTQGGLSRFKDNRIATITQTNGLPCNAVHWMREDNANSIWLNTECGLVRIPLTEMKAWAATADGNKDTERKIQLTFFDSSDGVRTRAYPSGFYPEVTKSADGKLWFAVEDGLSVIDPSHLTFNTLPPPVHVEQLVADRKTYDATAQVRLPALIRDLEIDYTALSLVAPEKIQFRYKLEGYDRDWQDAGNRRQAFYTNLPPRNYRFRVMASNNSGVWNEVGTYFDFTIPPAYYQTIWFRVLLVIGILLVLYALYQLRVRQVAQQVRAGMEGRLDERERIARDLHDTLLQSVQGLILKFHAGIRQIPSEIPARETMEKALDHADQVLAEGRDRVRNLRATASSLDDLPEAFKRVAEESPQGREIRFKTVVEGGVRELHRLVQEESYCIGREAIINALTHSEGNNVEVEIIYEPRTFRLRVRDDGQGIDHKILAEGGRSNHWGMQGMRERANKIGAELKIWSAHETGTELELTVPGQTAYHDGLESKHSWSARYKKLMRK